MRQTLLLFALLAVSATTHPSSPKMWGCAPIGGRLNVLYLMDRGGSSYVKFSGQRVSATLTAEGADQRWSWGSNAVVLNLDNIATYYEGATVKARFECKRFGGEKPNIERTPGMNK